MKMVRRIAAAVLLASFLSSLQAALCQQSAVPTQEDGIQALNARDFVRAEQIFSTLHKSAPSAENTGYLAMAEAGAGDLAGAISHFQESIRMGNDGAAAHYNLGVAYLNSHRDDEGIRELRAANTKDPSFPPCQRALGLALLNTQHPREALPYLQQARRQLPRDPEVWVGLVHAQFELRNDEAALQTTDQVMQAIPGNPLMNEALADLCLKYNQLAKARSILEESNDLAPNDPNIALSLARVSLQAGEPIEALAALKDVPSGAGLPGEPMYLRGEARTMTNEYVIAEVDYTAAIHADPRNAGYLAAYARLQQLEGDFGKALDTLNQAGELKTRGPEIPFRMAVSYYYQGLWPQAAESCEEAIRQQPDDVVAYLLLGGTKFRLNDLPGAEKAFLRAVTLKPDVAYFRIALAVAEYHGGSFAESIRQLDQALVLNPQSAKAHYYRARAFSKQGEQRKAIEDLETAVAIQPHYRQAFAELARLYTRDGQSEKARAALASERAEKQQDENENKRMQQQLQDSTDDIGDVLRFSEILKSR